MALSFGIVLNGLRLRQRLSALGRIPTTAGDLGNEDDHDFVVVHPPGVVVDDDTRRQAIAYARAEALDVLDLVPGDLPFDQMLDLARVVDTTTYRTTPFAAGRGALHALVVRREVWDRAQPATPDAPAATERVRDRADLVRLTERLKQHAVRSTDLAVASHLHAVPGSAVERLGELEATYGAFLPVALAIPAARSALLVTGVALSPGWGVATIACYLLQPYLVRAGSAFDPNDRSPLDNAARRVAQPIALVWAAGARTTAGDATKAAVEDPIEARRPEYAAALAAGLGRFFESRRDTCPWCGAIDLVERVRTTDLGQFKPGEFVIEECAGCGLLFQNPRLSLDGLDFYYRDFYDGLGARETQFLFASSEPAYRGRVALARRHASPRAWLDVGTGYGHFCAIARGLLPETRFDGLDMGTSIDEARRHGWIDRAYRGLFPDLSEELTGAYDLVSMHHYLEHTRDPKAELRAAHAVLEPGGHLLIEVPDPESRFADLLGGYWLPWFQPQHQQFVPVGNLCTELEAQGFAVVEVERGPVHLPVDLAGAVWTWGQARAPKPRVPWRNPPTGIERTERAVIMAAVGPVALMALAVDRVLKKVINTRGAGWSNAYRVLARRLP
jgi:SAM-dependent methyltransferase